MLEEVFQGDDGTKKGRIVERSVILKRDIAFVGNHVAKPLRNNEVASVIIVSGISHVVQEEADTQRQIGGRAVKSGDCPVTCR
jgi:hypothetical protein